MPNTSTLCLRDFARKVPLSLSNDASSTASLSRHRFVLSYALMTLAAGAWLPLSSSGQETHAPEVQYSRGAIPPEDLQARVIAQSRIAASQLHFLAMSGVGAPQKPKCDRYLPHFDWRDAKKVTDIEFQGGCGSCWDFAAIAAYESSALIENNLEADKLTPGQDRLSAQQQLDCAWPAYSCLGGWHDKVFENIRGGSGAVDVKGYPSAYFQRKGPACLTPSDNATHFGIDTWAWVGNGLIPSDAELKDAICEHGPIVTGVNADGWDRYHRVEDVETCSGVNPDWPTDGVFRGGQPSKSDLSWETFHPGDIDHEVLIVGWDNDLKAWIIKNSWGACWGDKGYMYLQFGTGNIGFNSAWVRASYLGIETPVQRPLSGEERKILRELR